MCLRFPPSSFTIGNLLSSKTIPDMMPSPSTTNSAAAMAERRNHEMFAERHADRIFQVWMGKLKFDLLSAYIERNSIKMMTYPTSAGPQVLHLVDCNSIRTGSRIKSLKV
jgi:hypothetical protein